MASGSFKELTKVINAYIPTLDLPLPEDLIQVIQAYLDKHHPIEESDSQRLQDELLNIYQRDVKNSPQRYAIFIAILRQLRPAITGAARVLQWWETLIVPTLDYLAKEKGLAAETRGMLLDILAYDTDDGDNKHAANTSAALSEKLLEIWLKNSTISSSDGEPSAHFIEEQMKLVLIEFGKKRPKDFLIMVDKFFVKKDYRAQILLLICEFIRNGPPHLHQLLQTPLFNNLLRCLQIDTSTTIISLAMTALIMFLPHIPNNIATHLPALFNIYCRILFWERERELSSESVSDQPDAEKIALQENDAKESPEWEQLSYSFESDSETVPELSHYFTFLYGLYPINFMSYIRKPGRYLRHANSHSVDNIEVQPSEIRQRSEPFRQGHLLHPNFYTMTIESELTDLNRWMNSEAADVVASCMALCAPIYPLIRLSSRVPQGPGIPPIITEDTDIDRDASDKPLLSRDDVRTSRLYRLSTETDNASWRNTTSTIVDTPDSSRRQSSAERKVSQSKSMPIADSPTLGPLETQTDSPTLPPPLLRTDSQERLERAPMFQRGLQQSLPNESEISFISSQQREPSIADSYLQSLEKYQAPGSPSLRPSPTEGLTEATAEGNWTVTSLRREIMLLRNEMNFERYLKQQHLSHIGELRRKHVKEATVEAETQHLLNSNKMLKSKLDEARNTITQMKKESEKSRTHSKKWEAELTLKLRALREEQKKWNIETEALHRDLESSIQSNNELKQLVVKAEADALGSKQKVQSIEGSVDELERLRAELDKLTGSLRTYEAREVEIERAKASEALALTKVEILEMKLQSRENELEIVRRAANRERDALKLELEEARLDLRDRQPQGFQSMLDEALAVSRSRLAEAQKAHGHLLMKYTRLQGQYLALKDLRSPDEPLLSGDGDDSYYGFGSGYRSGSPAPMRRIRRRGLSDPDLGDRSSHSITSPSENSSGYFPIRPARNDTAVSSVSGPRPSSQNEVRTPGQGLSGSQTLRHMRSGSADSAQASAGLNLNATGLSLDAAGKPKIKPNSEVRVYGRGGVQNVGTTPKDKKKKDKQKEGEDKKDKKGTGIRGIRGFA